MTQARRGTTLVEVSLALCLLAVAIAAAAQMLAVCARQRKSADRQFAAQIEASNIAERIATMSYSDVGPETLATMTLSPETQSALAGGELALECTNVAAPDLPHKRIAIEVAWSTRTEGRRAVHLTTWKYGPAQQLP